MGAADLKTWMEMNGKTTVDVASAAKISPATVTRFLNGARVRRVVLAALERVVSDARDGDGSPTPPRAA